jgi:hypothetical protein
MKYLSGADEVLQKNRVYDREYNLDTNEPITPTPKAVEDIDDLFSQLSSGAGSTADLSYAFPRVRRIAKARVDALLETVKQFEADSLSRTRPSPVSSPIVQIDADSPSVAPQEQPRGAHDGFVEQANAPIGARLKGNGPKGEQTHEEYLVTAVFAAALYQGVAANRRDDRPAISDTVSSRCPERGTPMSHAG